MKVLFLYPSWTTGYGIFRHFARKQAIWPPLSLALLGAITEQRGHEVGIIDGEAENLSLEKMIAMTQEVGPDVIGLTAFTPFFHINVSLAQGLKNAGVKAPIAIGGPHVTIVEEKALQPMFDYAFVGEAEKSWPTFLDYFEGGKDLSGVKGIIFRKNGEICSTGRPDPIDDHEGRGYPLDQFPLPARHLLKMNLYKSKTVNGRQSMTSIQTTRGCPWKCIFCASDKLDTTRVIQRSPRSVVDEMKAVISEFGVQHFYFIDDVLTMTKEHILEICDLIVEEGLSITFEGSTRANLVDDQLMRRLVHAGLTRISFGLETVDSEMRKTMKKQIPLEHYEKANRICNKHGVETLNSVMIGLPGETRETIRKTMVWLSTAREVKQANFAIAVPYPGTEFHEMARNGNGVNLLTEDFSEYRRYGTAVTKVGELGPEDLIELQNEGFVSVYSAPWRWIPMLRKNGLLGGILMLLRVVSLVLGRVFPRLKGVFTSRSSGDKKGYGLAEHSARGKAR